MERASRLPALAKLKLSSNTRMVSNAAALVGTTGVTSVLGFAYWWLAARRFPVASVGLAQAMVSAMMLLGTLGMLGLGTLLIGQLARERHHAPTLVVTAVLMAGGASALLGAGFAWVAPLISHELGPLASSAGSVLLFAFGAAMTGMGLVLDQAALGVNRGWLQFWRNLVFSVAKLAALLGLALWIGDRAGLSIFATWVAGSLVSLAVVVLLEVAQRRFNDTYRLEPGSLSGLKLEALQHHALNMVLMAPNLLLPLIVTATLSATTNAYFYTAWMLNGFVTVVPVALSTVLFAAGSAKPELFRSKFRFTFSLSALFGLLAIAIIFFAGERLLGLFGAEYASEAATALKILNLGVIPLVISEHFVTLSRINRRPGGATLPLAVGNALKLVLAYVGAKLGGLVGLSAGIVAASFLVALFLAPVVLRALAGKTVVAEGAHD